MEETIELSKRLWTGDKVDYDGEYYTVEGAVCRPRPVQEPHPPIMIGGGGEEFTLRIAAKHADEWNYWGPTSVMERKLDVLASHCETYGTSFEEIDISWFTRCLIRESDAAVEQLLDDAPRFRDPDDDDPLSEYHNLIGTPAEIVTDIERFAALGVDEIDIEFVDFPDTRGMELFADRVLPAVG
jgi:alkanesulfonate monooxygenase SsuD/methylene tetrahydromethanopterin reductase-like flavin-dependent oxidoreductase (luciferase family)